MYYNCVYYDLLWNRRWFSDYLFNIQGASQIQFEIECRKKILIGILTLDIHGMKAIYIQAVFYRFFGILMYKM